MLEGGRENAFSEKQLDSVQVKTLVVSATEPIVDRRHNRLLLLPKRRQTDGRKLPKGFWSQRRKPFRGKIFSKELVRIRRVIIGVFCESFRFFCNVSARSRHVVNVGVVFLPSLCDGFCVSVFSLGQGSRGFCHELYGQSTVMFCKSGQDACF